MRLWHKDLIPVLPKNQLVSQWRECCAIAKNITDDGTPNHLLVNKVLDYPPTHFILYINMVVDEMKRRGYHIRKQVYLNMVENLRIGSKYFNTSKYKTVLISTKDIFSDWHNDRYLIQCYYNLEEKYDCGGINKDEFDKIKEVFSTWQ